MTIPTNLLARSAGVSYLILAVTGGFSELYVRSSVRVPGDAAATVANIAQNAILFRIGFGADLVAFVAFLTVGLLMYFILKPVDERIALTMLMLNVVSIPIQSLNMLNQLRALLVATDRAYTAGLTAETNHALVLLLVDLQRHGYLIAQIFFGLYLLPLGYLVYRSGFFPRVLGVLLMIGCFSLLAEVLAIYLSPGFESSLASYLAIPSGLGELLFILWLLIMGAGRRGARQSRVSAGAT